MATLVNLREQVREAEQALWEAFVSRIQKGHTYHLLVGSSSQVPVKVLDHMQDGAYGGFEPYVKVKHLGGESEWVDAIKLAEFHTL